MFVFLKPSLEGFSSKHNKHWSFEIRFSFHFADIRNAESGISTFIFLKWFLFIIFPRHVATASSRASSWDVYQYYLCKHSENIVRRNVFLITYVQPLLRYGFCYKLWRWWVINILKLFVARLEGKNAVGYLMLINIFMLTGILQSTKATLCQKIFWCIDAKLRHWIYVTHTCELIILLILLFVCHLEFVESVYRLFSLPWFILPWTSFFDC